MPSSTLPTTHLRLPHLRRPGPHPLIQTDCHRIHRIDLPIKCSLEVPVRTQAFFDEPTAAPARPQRQALEPPDISVVEEHVAYGDDDLVWVAG
jgi:hypothetical protein